MAGLKSKINQNCKLLKYADDVAVYSVNRYSRIGISKVEKSIQSIKLYLRKVAWRWNQKKMSVVYVR
jgi:predicted AAA+ superfamily ATPase